MSREFRVGRLAAVALIGALISEIWFRDRRDGGLEPAASRFASDRTRDRADMGLRHAAAPVFTFIEPTSSRASAQSACR
jgi:hypothetical protein